MSDFKMLKLTDRALYWYEVASYIAPFATIGSLIMTGFSLASENRQEKRLEEISRKLEEIKNLIINTRISLERKLNDITMKERTGAILGIVESLKEYQSLKSQGILDNIITESNTVKGKIKTYIESSDVELEYTAGYCGLYLTLLPLRIATFELYDRPISKINGLVIGETEDILGVEEISISSAETIGSKRVSHVNEDPFELDELGPIVGTTFSVKIDNRTHGVGIFDPRNGDLNAVRAQARQQRDVFARQKAQEASAPFREVFAAARETLERLRNGEP